MVRIWFAALVLSFIPNVAVASEPETVPAPQYLTGTWLYQSGAMDWPVLDYHQTTRATFERFDPHGYGIYKWSIEQEWNPEIPATAQTVPLTLLFTGDYIALGDDDGDEPVLAVEQFDINRSSKISLAGEVVLNGVFSSEPTVYVYQGAGAEVVRRLLDGSSPPPDKDAPHELWHYSQGTDWLISKKDFALADNGAYRFYFEITSNEEEGDPAETPDRWKYRVVLYNKDGWAVGHAAGDWIPNNQPGTPTAICMGEIRTEGEAVSMRVDLPVHHLTPED